MTSSAVCTTYILSGIKLLLVSVQLLTSKRPNLSVTFLDLFFTDLLVPGQSWVEVRVVGVNLFLLPGVRVIVRRHQPHGRVVHFLFVAMLVGFNATFCRWFILGYVVSSEA